MQADLCFEKLKWYGLTLAFGQSVVQIIHILNQLNSSKSGNPVPNIALLFQVFGHLNKILVLELLHIGLFTCFYWYEIYCWANDSINLNN